MHIVHVISNAAEPTETRLWKEVFSSIRHNCATKVSVIGINSLPSSNNIIENHQGIDIIKISKPLNHIDIASPLLKILRMSLTFRALSRAIINASPNVIHVHSLLSLPAAKIAKVRIGARIIYDCHELETETMASKGMMRIYRKFVERFYIRYADEVLVVSPSIADWYEQAYGRRPKLLRAFPDLEWQSSQGGQDLFREHFGIPKDELIFLYQGALFKGRLLTEILEAFSLVDPGKHLVIMGYGDLEEEVRVAASKHPRIHFKEAVPSTEVLKWTICADVGLTGGEDACLSYRYSLPNKLYAYAACGLAILATDLVEMRRFVTERECGWVMPFHAEGIAKQINSLTKEQILQKKSNSAAKASEINWKQDEPVLLDAYRTLEQK